MIGRGASFAERGRFSYVRRWLRGRALHNLRCCVPQCLRQVIPIPRLVVAADHRLPVLGARRRMVALSEDLLFARSARPQQPVSWPSDRRGRLVAAVRAGKTSASAGRLGVEPMAARALRRNRPTTSRRYWNASTSFPVSRRGQKSLPPRAARASRASRSRRSAPS